MSSPKTFKRYASQWLKLFDEFKDHPTKPKLVPCPSEKKAQALRLEFYKARETFLKDEGMRQEYEAALNGREVRITPENDVLFDVKDSNWVGKLIDASFENGKQ